MEIDRQADDDYDSIRNKVDAAYPNENANVKQMIAIFGHSYDNSGIQFYNESGFNIFVNQIASFKNILAANTPSSERSKVAYEFFESSLNLLNIVESGIKRNDDLDTTGKIGRFRFVSRMLTNPKVKSLSYYHSDGLLSGKVNDSMMIDDVNKLASKGELGLDIATVGSLNKAIRVMLYAINNGKQDFLRNILTLE